MIYIKTPRGKRVYADKLDFYCLCPVCGKEVSIQDFWDIMSASSVEFDESSAILCDECAKICMDAEG